MDSDNNKRTTRYNFHLDFEIPTDEERVQEVYLVLSKLKTVKPSELETMANYILWGKDQNDSNLIKEGYIINPSRRSAWGKKQDVSLEMLMENPMFSEERIHELDANAGMPRQEVFSRVEARERAPKGALEALESLWDRIDFNDCVISYYRNTHDKKAHRTPENLAAIESRIGEMETLRAKKLAKNLSSLEYTAIYQETVGLRKEQYTVRDTYQELKVPRGRKYAQVEKVTGLRILPLDVERNYRYLTDTDGLLQLPPMGKVEVGRNEAVLDFSKEDDVRSLFAQMGMLEDEIEAGVGLESFMPMLKDTLEFYLDFAEIAGDRRRIIELRADGLMNKEVAERVGEEFGKEYDAKYIATIVNQQVVPQVANAARIHAQIAMNPGSFNFKTCERCGKTKVLEGNFTSRKRNKDGYTNTCKVCEKEKKELQEAAWEQAREERRRKGLKY